MDRGGLRLKLFKAQAEAGDIVLLFADESEALTHPYLARAWAKKGADLRVPAPGQAQKIAIMGSLDYAQRKLTVTTSRTKRSADFIAHLHALDRLYGPRPGAPAKPVVLVLDNRPINVSKACRRRWPNAPTGSPPNGCPNTPRVEQHRNRLGRLESASPCASNLRRPRQPRERRPPRRRRLEFSTKSRSVGYAANLCLGSAQRPRRAH